MFVTASDFARKEYSIPNLDSVINSFNSFIERREKEALKSLLGLTLYDSFIDGLDEDYPEERWLALKNGARYMYNGKEYEWVGMKELLIPYVYSEWVANDETILTGVGTGQSKTENLKRLKPVKKISDAFNDYSEKAGGCCEYKNTLYGFLYQEGQAGTFDNTFDESFQTFIEYLNVNFKEPGHMNAFGI